MSTNAQNKEAAKIAAWIRKMAAEAEAGMRARDRVAGPSDVRKLLCDVIALGIEHGEHRGP